MPTLTQERLKELLHYDPETGVFTWRVDRSKAKAGDTITSTDARGRPRLKIDYVEYRASRLAWLYITGEWPSGQVDHANLNHADNRWLNLRDSTPVENGINRRKPSRKSPHASPLKGVMLCRGGRWNSRIKANGKRIFLGIFDTQEEAHAAYAAAATELHGQFARLA